MRAGTTIVRQTVEVRRRIDVLLERLGTHRVTAQRRVPGSLSRVHRLLRKWSFDWMQLWAVAWERLVLTTCRMLAFDGVGGEVLEPATRFVKWESHQSWGFCSGQQRP